MPGPSKIELEDDPRVTYTLNMLLRFLHQGISGIALTPEEPEGLFYLTRMMRKFPGRKPDNKRFTMTQQRCRRLLNRMQEKGWVESANIGLGKGKWYTEWGITSAGVRYVTSSQNAV